MAVVLGGTSVVARDDRFAASSKMVEKLQLALKTSEIAGTAVTARLRLHNLEKDWPMRRIILNYNPRMEVKFGPGSEVSATAASRAGSART